MLSNWLPSSWTGDKDEPPKEGEQHALPVKATESRSTSPGSTRSPSLATTSTSASPAKAKVAGLPDIEYPGALSVQNTFLNLPSARPASLEGFYQERGFRSCPASAIDPPPGLLASDVPQEAEEEEALQAQRQAEKRVADKEVEVSQKDPSSPKVCPQYWPRTMSGDGLEDLLASMALSPDELQALSPNKMIPQDLSPATPDRSPAKCLPPPPATRAPDFLPTRSPSPPPPPSFSQATELPVPLRLAQVFPEPDVGTDDAPTLGSRNHRFGTCRPCAFKYTKGCGNGVNCEFCHLCEPGEKKRRAKDRAATRKMMKDQMPLPLTGPGHMPSPYVAGSPLGVPHGYPPMPPPSYGGIANAYQEHMMQQSLLSAQPLQPDWGYLAR